MTGCDNSRSTIMEPPVSTNAATRPTPHRTLCLSAAVLSCISWNASPASGQGAASTRDGMAMSDSGAMASMSMAMDGGLMNAPHMRMTALTRPQPGDSARAAAVLVALRAALVPYADYHRALADGFRIFAPRVPQHVYHFSSPMRGLAAMIHFDPAAPSSLLYEKTGDSSYKLVGAMYTSPKWASLSDLDERVPLSFAQWHLHTNWCLPKLRDGARLGERGPDGRQLFGGRGSITTKEACDAANGRFFKQPLGWMVHVYPSATNPAEIWGRDAMHEMAGDDD
jgi:hypothetical protein